MSQIKHPFSGKVLHIDTDFFLLELDEKFKVVSRNAVKPEERHSLAGVWHSIPTVNDLLHLSNFKSLISVYFTDGNCQRISSPYTHHLP